MQISFRALPSSGLRGQERSSPAGTGGTVPDIRPVRGRGFSETSRMQQNKSRLSSRRPALQELSALAEDVTYEIQMFWVAAERYAAMKRIEDERPFTPVEQCVSNAWSEVHWLHLRNLLDFFTSQPQKDDVVASDYVPGWTKSDGGDALMDLEALRSRCNKHLQHLAAARKRSGSVVDPPGTTEYTAVRMKVLTDAFFARLDAARMAWFAPHVAKAIEVSAFRLPS